MRKIAALFFTFAFVLMVSAVAFGQNRRLADTAWELVEANGIAVTNSSAAIKFDGNSTKFTGNTGCNQMFGSVLVRGRNIDFEGIGTTKRMCKLMAGNVAENVFLKALKNASRFTTTNEILRLIDRRGRTVLKFKRSQDGKQDSLQLQDRKWVLEQIKGRQTFAPLPYAFINFDAKKNGVGGDSSCNAFGGNYKKTGKSISITEIISTMRACVEDNKMSVQDDLFGGLRLARRFEIRNGLLQLYRGNELLLTFRAEDK
jgi:heat shock protein HslJ